MNTTLKSAAMAVVATMIVASPMIGPFSQIADARPPIIQEPLALNYDAGDVLPVTIDETVSSQFAHPGDTFTATVQSSQAGYHRLRGASVTGHITSVRPSNGHRSGRLGVEFDTLTTRGGKVYNISGSLIDLNDKAIRTNGDGVMVAKKTEKKNILEYVGIGAGAGTILGILGGGGIRVGTILLEGAIGAAAGELSHGKKESHDVILKAGTKIGVRLNQGFNYPNY